MAGVTNLLNLLCIPSDFSTDYFSNVDLAKRSKERGYNFFVNGYVHALKLQSSTDGFADISAKCFRSMKKNESPHKINMTLSMSEKIISDSHCSCQAGISGTCSHAVSVVYTLAHYKNLGMTDIPSELSCTSLPQQWHKPRGPKISAEPVAAMVFAKPKFTPRKKRPVYCSVPSDRIPPINEEDIKKLKLDKSMPLSYLLEEDQQTIDTPYGAVQIGSMLPYQLKNYRDHPVVSQTKCGVTVLPRDKPEIVILQDLHCNTLNERFKTTQEQAVSIEKSTIHQSENALWHTERRLRLTASQFGRICKRKKDVNVIFLNSIFKESHFKSEATSYGKAHESKAKQKYIELHQDEHIHDCGLVINPNFSFLAASPDGKICISEETGIIEIKCPFSARDMSIEQAVDSLPNFCLSKNVDSFYLKKQHEYFYQVQGQLMVAGVSFCIFVVYTKTDIFVQKILPDNDFIKQLMFDKLEHFYSEYGLQIN